MEIKSGIQIIMVILYLLVILPIWYYLLFKILQAVNATDLMWFLYWIYLPVGIVSNILSEIVKQMED